MMSKILTLLLNALMNSSLMSSEKSDRGFLANFNLASLRRVLMIFAGILASLIFFAGGLMTIVLDLVLSSRDQHAITLSPTSYVGLGLIVFSIFSIALMSRRKLWLLPSERPQQSQTSANVSAPILDLVAGLIAEFAEDRRVERELKMQAATQAMAAASAAASTAVSANMTEVPTGLVSTETSKDPNRTSFN